MHPYKPAHAARRLADWMGVTPTIESLKIFEEIAHIEEVPPSPPALFSRLLLPPPVASSSRLTTEDLHVPAKGDFTMDSNMDGDEDEEMLYSWGETPLEGDLFEDYGRQVPNDSLSDCTLTCPPPECEGSRLSCNIVYKNKFSYLNHFANCGVCKGKKRTNDGDYNVLWIMDSGASLHFSGKSTDFADLKLFSKDQRPKANTANGVAEIQGLGTVFIKHQVTDITARDKMVEIHTRLFPVYYMEGMSSRLLSMGDIINSGSRLKGTNNVLTFWNDHGITMEANTHQHPNIYWVESAIETGVELNNHVSVYSLDYDTLHRRMGHPSDQVLEKFKNHSDKFLSEL
ncbi:hypothetical protein CPB83DRAFT_937198, partial [Crepidotus variabilis]